MADVEKSYVALRELCIKQKFMESYGPELVTFWALWEYKTLEQIAKIAEWYDTAHPVHKHSNPNKYCTPSVQTLKPKQILQREWDGAAECCVWK